MREQRIISFDANVLAMNHNTDSRLRARLTMKHYPSILGAGSHYAPKGKKCIAFKKYDGSNLRFEWERKKGWHLFGTRDRQFDRNDPDFGCAIDLFLNKYASPMERIIAKNKHFRGTKEVVCYCEFFGPYSFSGQHDPAHPRRLY